MFGKVYKGCVGCGGGLLLTLGIVGFQFFEANGLTIEGVFESWLGIFNKEFKDVPESVDGFTWIVGGCVWVVWLGITEDTRFKTLDKSTFDGVVLFVSKPSLFLYNAAIITKNAKNTIYIKNFISGL